MKGFLGLTWSASSRAWSELGLWTIVLCFFFSVSGVGGEGQQQIMIISVNAVLETHGSLYL